VPWLFAVQNQNFKLALFNPANFPELNGPASLRRSWQKTASAAVRQELRTAQ